MDENTVIIQQDTNINNDDTDIKMPKNTKANRYYWKHREEILGKRRELRLKEKGDKGLTKEEEQKKKMAFLGLIQK